jgi:hypothetical protein
MSNKRCIASAAAVIGILFASDLLVHGMLLKGSYEATASLWRPMAEMESLMWTMWVMYLVNALVLPYVYSKGHESGKGAVGQGLRFGLIIGLPMATGMSLGTYFMIPLPVSMAVSWFVAGMVQFALVGVAIGLLHRPRT